MYELLLIQAFRPDRLLAMSHIFVERVLGNSFMETAAKELNLADIIEKEVRNLIQPTLDYPPLPLSAIKIIETNFRSE